MTPGVGVLVPADFALDRELWRWVPDQVPLHVTRLSHPPAPVDLNLATALSDVDMVAKATRDVLVPQPHTVVYACASGSFVNGPEGERRLTEAMLAAGAPSATTTSGALVDALAAVRARRVAVVTPYVDSVTVRLLDFLAGHGVEVVAAVGLGLVEHIWRVSETDIVNATLAADRPAADAVFLSCTNLPTFDLIEPLERRLGKPVLSANQVTLWSATRDRALRAA